LTYYYAADYDIFVITVPERHRQTDRQTERQTGGRTTLWLNRALRSIAR